MRAIQHAFKVLDWFEHLLSGEVPPEWMWPFDEELELWFEEVEANRKAKYGGSSEDDDGGELMMRNEFAKGRK